MWFYITQVRYSLQLMAGESIFLLHSKRRKLFFIRLIPALAAYLAIVYGLLQIHTNSWTSMLRYLAMFLMTLSIMYLCFDVKIKDVVFAGTGGYALQHSVYCLMVVISYFTGTPDTSTALGIFLDYLIFRTTPYIIVDCLAYFFLVRPAVKLGDLENKNPKILILSVLILASAIVLNNMSGMRFGDSGYNRFTTNVVCKIYSIICCLTVLLMQLVMFRGSNVKRDKELLEYMLELQREQYAISKETIELINLKSHDLKHQMLAFSTMTEEERKKSIAEIKNGIGIYDSTPKTGNSSLDLVLMEKALFCEKHDIKFSYLVDAEKLSVMSPVDIYSLFGNALDNAIKSVNAEDDPEKRLISLNVHSEGDMLFIHLENYFDGQLEFKDNLPVTSGDKRYHGFGTKSISHIVKKYDGELRMSAEDYNFNLDILLPLTK